MPKDPRRLLGVLRRRAWIILAVVAAGAAIAVALGNRAGRKRGELERWFSGPEGPSALFAGRALPFDETAALVWARLMAVFAAVVVLPSDGKLDVRRSDFGACPAVESNIDVRSCR